MAGPGPGLSLIAPLGKKSFRKRARIPSAFLSGRQGQGRENGCLQVPGWLLPMAQRAGQLAFFNT